MPVHTTDDSPQTVIAVERAFSLLHALARDDQSQGVTALSQVTGLPKSTVSRLLTTLDGLRMVERAGAGGRYRLGPGLAVFTPGASSSLVELARPRLQELVDEIGEDAGLAVVDGFDVLYVDQIHAPRAIQVRDWTGSRLVPHAVASGYILMRSWSPEKLEEYLAGSLESLTVDTTTDSDVIKNRVSSWDDYAWTRGEFVDDLNGVAAPIRGPSGGIVAAVNLYGPAYRFPGDRGEAETGELLAAVGRQISTQLTTLSFSRDGGRE